jgi:pyruvate kinase
MKQPKFKNTKIVATVGPACDSYEKLLELVEAGVDIFRLNFSHANHDDLRQVINHINYINEKYNQHVSILADLQGPKLRVGVMENDGLPIKEGDILTFVNEKCVGNKDKIYMSYELFPKDVKVGEKVMVDDGKIVLEVVSTNEINEVKLKVLFGEMLSSKKGVNLPDTNVSMPSITEKDMKDIDFILTQPSINWVALSFVRTPKEVKQLRKILEDNGHEAKVISKIEKPEAIRKLDKIIKASNGIMIARGDLGVELPMEKLPHLQKEIIKKCIQRARPVIVATQMMDSMINNPSPTRAEITDVANAVLDGTDAVMLSGETSVGRHPVEVVKAMCKIIDQAESHFSMSGKRPQPSPKSRTFHSDAVCFNAARTAVEIGAKGIIGMTSSGYTAFKVSSFRPDCPIYIFSDKQMMLATLNLVWGVRCFYYDKFTTTDETIEDVTEILKREVNLKTGDVLVNTGSMPLHRRHRTNMLKVTVID